MKKISKILITIAIIFLPLFSFAQPEPDVLISYTIGETSADLFASGFSPEKQVSIFLINLGSGANEGTYNTFSDSDGNVEFTLNNLKLDTNYQVSVASKTEAASAEFRTETLGGGQNNPPSPPSPITPPGNQGDLSSPGGGLVPKCPKTGCGWNEFMELVAKVIDFLIFYLSLPIAAIAFAYAGFLLMTSGDNPGKRTTAIDIFKKVGLGLVIAMAAWLIVNTIITTLVKPGLIDDYSIIGIL